MRGDPVRGLYQLLCLSGLLTIAQPLDRERTALYRLNVSATDHGTTSSTTYMLLDVHVIDVNDNAPVFDHSVYTVNVSENQAAGTVVHRVHASDRDAGQSSHHAPLIYSNYTLSSPHTLCQRTRQPAPWCIVYTPLTTTLVSHHTTPPSSTQTTLCLLLRLDAGSMDGMRRLHTAQSTLLSPFPSCYL